MPVALVTGASRGIGLEVARALAAGGSDVIGVSRDATTMSVVEEATRAGGRQFHGIALDLSAPQAPAEAADRAWDWQGRIDILVNAAGVLFRRPDAEVRTEEFDKTFALNVRAPFVLMERVGGRMVNRGGGSIINIASVAGQVVTRAPGPYQASKAALIHLTRYYAAQLAPTVRVNAVGPGYIRTELTAAWLADASNERWVQERTALGRVGEGAEVAEAVAFLSSDRASYITGQHLLVDGGWTLG